MSASLSLFPNAEKLSKQSDLAVASKKRKKERNKEGKKEKKRKKRDW
jgi:hypothetical protein